MGISGSLSLSLTIITFAAFSRAAHTCSDIAPISLPISNVTFGDGIGMNRGVEVFLGNQVLSLRVSTLFSNTRLRNARDCAFGNATVQTGCLGSSGSTFDIQKSTTWSTAPQGTWNVTVTDPVQSSETVITGYDTAKFYSLPEIPNLPTEVWSDLHSDNKSGLALGPNSSFIQSLLSRSLIPSSAFGLFFGSRSQTRGVDGNLTLGGIDRARLNGSWANFTTQAHYSSARCPLQVLVKDIRLNNERGSFSLFADAGSSVIACIDPLQNQFTFTQTMYNIFASLTQHPTDPTVEGGDDFTEQTFPLSSGPLLGGLTVELENGYKTEIPGYEFVSQQRGTDVQGKYAVINESRLMVAAGTTGTSSLNGIQVPILGGVFLSQNYLMVDYEAGIFRLAPAKLGKVDDHDHDIMKICDGKEVETSNSVSTGSSKPSGGAIGGIVAAVLVAIAVISFGIWWCMRKRRSRSKQPEQLIPGSNSDSRNEAAQVDDGIYEQRDVLPAIPTARRRDMAEFHRP